MQAGIPWTAIQDMPPDKVYAYQAFMLEKQEASLEQKRLENLGKGRG